MSRCSCVTSCLCNFEWYMCVLCVSLVQKASSALGYGVRFNAVCPWFVQTDLLGGLEDKLGRFLPMSDATQQIVAQGTLTWVSRLPVWSQLKRANWHWSLYNMTSCVNRQFGFCLELRFHPIVSVSSTSQVAHGCLELVTDETKNEAILKINIPGNEYQTYPELNVEDKTGA